MGWQPELDELRQREAFAKKLGGVDKVVNLQAIAREITAQAR